MTSSCLNMPMTSLCVKWYTVCFRCRWRGTAWGEPSWPEQPGVSCPDRRRRCHAEPNITRPGRPCWLSTPTRNCPLWPSLPGQPRALLQSWRGRRQETIALPRRPRGLRIEHNPASMVVAPRLEWDACQQGAHVFSLEASAHPREVLQSTAPFLWPDGGVSGAARHGTAAVPSGSAEEVWMIAAVMGPHGSGGGLGATPSGATVHGLPHRAPGLFARQAHVTWPWPWPWPPPIPRSPLPAHSNSGSPGEHLTASSWRQNVTVTPSLYHVF